MIAYKRKTNHQTWNDANIKVGYRGCARKNTWGSNVLLSNPATKMQESGRCCGCSTKGSGQIPTCAYQTYGEHAFWFHPVATEESRI